MACLEHAWAVFDELRLLSYFRNPTSVPGSTDYVQLSSGAVAQTILLGPEHANRVPVSENSVRVRVGPIGGTLPPPIKKTGPPPIQDCLTRSKAALVPLIVIVEEAVRLVDETTRYIVLGQYTIINVDYGEQHGCSLILKPCIYTHPHQTRLVATDVWNGIQCAKCNRLIHIEDWTHLVCANCHYPNGSHLPTSTPLFALRPPHRMPAVGARIDRGFANLPPSVTRKRTVMSDATEICTYEGLGQAWNLPKGKELTVHHVLATEMGGGGSGVGTRAMLAIQERTVMMERQKKGAVRIPLMTHLTGSPSPSCVQTWPGSFTPWDETHSTILDLIDLLNSKAALCRLDADEFTQLLAIHHPFQRSFHSSHPRYRPPPSTAHLAFIPLGSDNHVLFRPVPKPRPRSRRPPKTSLAPTPTPIPLPTPTPSPAITPTAPPDKVVGLEFELVHHGDIFFLEGSGVDEIEWVVGGMNVLDDGMKVDPGEHFAFVARHVPLDPPTPAPVDDKSLDAGTPDPPLPLAPVRVRSHSLPPSLSSHEPDPALLAPTSSSSNPSSLPSSPLSYISSLT